MAALTTVPRVAFSAGACALLALACQTELPAVDYKLYPGPPRPPGEVARLEFGALQRVSIDGLWASNTDWRRVELAPGRHFVVWDLPTEPSPPRGPDAQTHRRPGAWVELEAGHAYRWHHHYDHRRVPSDFLWLQDDATGLALAGERP